MNERGGNGKTWIRLGAICLILAALITELNIREDIHAGTESQNILHEIEAMSGIAGEAILPEVPAQESETTEKTAEDAKRFSDSEIPEIALGDDLYVGTIEIPQLDLLLPVLKDYDDLKVQKAPCRFSGFAYSNDMVLSAHNYSQHFGRISELRAGDFAIFRDVDGNEFEYCLTEIETLKNTDVEEMITADDWDLTLFTCTVGGMSRVAARFCLVSGIPE